MNEHEWSSSNVYTYIKHIIKYHMLLGELGTVPKPKRPLWLKITVPTAS